MATRSGSSARSSESCRPSLQVALPKIREVFPGARIHGNDTLNLPGIIAADVIIGVNDRGVGTRWQWRAADGGALSVGFRAVALVEEPARFDLAAWSSGFSRDRGRLRISRPGRLFVPVVPAAAGGVLRVAATSPAGLGRSATIGLEFLGDDGTHELATEAHRALWGIATSETEVGFDGPWGPGCLVVDVSPSSTERAVSLEAVEIVGTSSQSPVVTGGPGGSPDIVLVILDAARADHFGCYGYGRDTTPNIDALAAGGLVFENAFATAPYTACSMPTMMSGLSFRDHGVVGRTRLDESVATLAESLQQAGYRTSCYSGNPNNAVARGMGQGCDVFEEFWRDRDRARRIDPYRLSARATERLAQPIDAPEFVMLHYVPPHEPYVPARGFDVFGDPDYDGGYDGSRDTILGIDTGALHPTEADMNEVRALHDGNLLTGDDAVGQVFEVLEARDRWENTVVLVVSDHGEAFGGHGRMSHNSTVYDEMLRVPFILKLPEGMVADSVDTAGLVSLEDVVPTLLWLADVDPAHQLSGVNLLASPQARRRGIVARSASNPPVLMYRTSRWKLIAGPEGSELYDLLVDSGERQSVHLDNLETAMCLRSLLESALTRPPLSSRSTEGVELTEEDERALRSLGYIR